MQGWHSKINHKKDNLFSRYISLFIIMLLLFPLSGFANIIINGRLSQEHSANPGAVFSGQISIINTSEKIVKVKIYQTDYRFFANGENFYDRPGTTKRSNANWIRFSPQIVNMPGKTDQTINYTVTVPLESQDNNSPLAGTYWSLLMVESLPVESIEKKDNRSQLAISTVMRYGIQIITNIESTGKKELLFSNTRLIKDDDNFSLQFDIENSGEYLLKPNVWLELYNNNGEPVGKFKTDARRTFPNTSIRHTINLDPIPHGDYKALVIADCGDEDLFGHQLALSIE